MYIIEENIVVSEFKLGGTTMTITVNTTTKPTKKTTKNKTTQTTPNNSN